MPRGLTRYYGGGDLHFITCSCYRLQPRLATAKARDRFLSVVEKMRRRVESRVSKSARPGAPIVD